jgi:riboflavin biosynthesis pyrimidine reductase
MEMLHQHFGVEKLAVVGGGIICGGFLESGVVDEISVMVAPGIDGRKGMTSVFDGIVKSDNTPYRLKLESVKQVQNEVVWLRYTTVK